MSESKGRKYNYEAMFLITQANSVDLGGVVDHIREIFRRAHAELIAMKKWDERRLAYEIDKQKRGLYILAYFSCDPVNIANMERDCNLSEKILRALILRADHLTVEEMQAAEGQRELETEAQLRKARALETPAAPAAEARPAEVETPA
ncbi:MAG TPA: 30S ribosomal protein S6 [Phycisphaerales bacterium]|nr:30S ribosomal protein S6 [Phycisphaerales bacterium]